MKEEVLKWIASGCGIDEGVRLLEKYSKNRFLVRIVKANPAKNLPLIARELSSIAGISSDSISQSVPASAGTRQRPSVGSFRDEFPFLNAPGCPMELKALVTDKFSSYYRYRRLHAQLWDCTTPRECADLARDIISSYQENRAIYEELDYYKKHGVILGKHPVFKHYNRMASLRKLSIKELVVKQMQLEHNVWRIESELKKKDKPHLDKERQERLQQKKAELAEVIRLL